MKSLKKYFLGFSTILKIFTISINYPTSSGFQKKFRHEGGKKNAAAFFEVKFQLSFKQP